MKAAVLIRWVTSGNVILAPFDALVKRDSGFVHFLNEADAAIGDVRVIGPQFIPLSRGIVDDLGGLSAANDVHRAIIAG